MEDKKNDESCQSNEAEKCDSEKKNLGNKECDKDKAFQEKKRDKECATSGKQDDKSLEDEQEIEESKE